MRLTFVWELHCRRQRSTACLSPKTVSLPPRIPGNGRVRSIAMRETAVPSSDAAAAGPEVIATAERTDPRQAKGIDKSILTVAAPRRYRNREHLRYVAQQACLICARKPSDPHHLGFTQPRALGRKVSDEFAVPLCRGHHRAVHRYATSAPGGSRPALTRSRLPAGSGKRRTEWEGGRLKDRH